MLCSSLVEKSPRLLQFCKWVFSERLSQGDGMKWGVRFGFLLSITNILALADIQLPIVVVTASYNNAQWYEKNLSSVFQQEYDNWRLLYIDDCSTDGTADLVTDYCAISGYQDRVAIIRNEERMGHLANQYKAIHSCKKEEIIVIVDGDDWLAHEHVFETINRIYQIEDVWLTYGQFWYLKKDMLGCCRPVPQSVFAQGTIRTFKPWVTSHLRTFYAGLFQSIAREDLYYQGTWYPMCADVAAMFSMIEMAGIHVKFIKEILYIYNDANTLNFYHNNMEKQRMIEKYIREQVPYEPLVKPPYQY